MRKSFPSSRRKGYTMKKNHQVSIYAVVAVASLLLAGLHSAWSSAQPDMESVAWLAGEAVIGSF